MIKVSRSAVPPPPELMKRGARAFEKLNTFFSVDFKDRIQRTPEFDSRIWKDARPALNDLFNKKCAYCESSLIADMGEVELFRPKIGAIGNDRKDKSPDHYWWLAYEWENLYLSCRPCNFYKASKFPVDGGRGSLRASLAELRQTEKPLLLDPCIDEPEEHLAFSDSGSISPLTDRGRFTIEVLNLNRPELVAAREQELNDAKETVKLKIAAHQYSSEVLEEMMAADRSYAAAKRQVLHRFVKEELGDVLEHLEEKEKQRTVRNVERGSKFISSVQQQSLDDDYLQQQQVSESAPVTAASSDEFLFQKTQYITKIRIRNFRVIEDLTIEFPPPQDGKKPWVIMLGENGMGKSSILKAVALALMGEANHRALKLHPGKFLRRNTDDGEIEVHLTGYTKPFILQFDNESKEFKPTDIQLHTLFFCYAGTRLLPTPRRRRRGVADNYARINNLFDPFLPLLDTKSWLLSLDDTRFGFSARAMKKLLMQDEERDLVREPQRKPKEVLLKASDSEDGDSLESLSDGYQSVIALAGDIMEIMLKHYDEIENSEGIVLIDEIDVHLHPRWKGEIVGLLRNVFPRVQFIVTTHDPLCLMGSLPGEVHVLHRHPETRDVQIKQIDVPRGASADQILTGFWFGLNSTLDDDTLAKLKRHREILRAQEPESDPERRELETELRKRLGTFADTSIDRMAQSVASEVIQDNTDSLTLEQREEMRRQIKEKLLQRLEQRKKGG